MQGMEIKIIYAPLMSGAEIMHHVFIIMYVFIQFSFYSFIHYCWHMQNPHIFWVFRRIKFNQPLQPSSEATSLVINFKLSPLTLFLHLLN